MAIHRSRGHVVFRHDPSSISKQSRRLSSASRYEVTPPLGASVPKDLVFFCYETAYFLHVSFEQELQQELQQESSKECDGDNSAKFEKSGGAVLQRAPRLHHHCTDKH
ncbi:MAG: hypothetical protein M3Z96_11185 [Pseudomonadota bacterium]|nr:hypothetical protein [Pseudomonadota bacterium]